jgi:hypothetical protein
VIVPTYNGAAHLAEALESIRVQGDDDIEVIAVDDGSTDATPDILERFARSMALRVVRSDHVGNWVAVTNRGLGMARGAYCSFLHQDDLWMPGRLDALRRDVEGGRREMLWVHSSWYVDGHRRRVGRLRCPLPERRPLSSDFVLERLLVQNFISIPSAAFPRAWAEEVSALDEGLWFTADWDFWLKLAAIGPTRYVGEPLCAYRVHPTALTMTGSLDSAGFRRQHEEVLIRHLPRWVQDRRPGRHPARIERAARFSVDTNVTLARLAHRQPARLAGLAAGFVRLGPPGWRRYVRDSRILERAAARVRAGIPRRRPGPGVGNVG